MIASVLRVIAIATLLPGLVPGVARGTPWQRPADGRIVGSFSYSAADPYAAGQRRGIVIAAAPGSVARATCAGRVVFAGAVGRAGPTLSVQCGELRATYQGVAAIAVSEASTVVPGQEVARVGPAGRLRLGARLAPNRYVDPATLFADRAPPLGPAPAARRARRDRPRGAPPPPGPTRRPASLTSPAPAPVPASVPASSPTVPLAAWLGLALLAATLPLGGLVRRTARARTTRARTARAGTAPGRPARSHPAAARAAPSRPTGAAPA